ncbi:MAG: FAD-dependent oxidoreductase [Bacteroidetes bacterium]|nr:FAD-dependent oxidoreductase [Bacteroidota bacterium]
MSTSSKHFDLIVLGSGPAGYSCAVQAAKMNKRVVVVEAQRDELGGTWIHTGTVPSKALKEAAKTIFKFHNQFGDEKGRKPFERFQMEDLIQYKSSILESKGQKIMEDLVGYDVQIIRGHGALKDPHTIDVTHADGSTSTLQATHILLATGSRQPLPETFELNGTTVLDIRAILTLTHIPRRLTIVGNTVNAYEFATIFASLGTHVAILCGKPELLSFLDRRIKKEMQKVLDHLDIRLFTSATIDHITKNPLRNCTEVGFHSEPEPDRLQILETDLVLHAGSTIPNTEGLGLEHVGVQLDEKGAILVNEGYQTAEPSIYAAGDVVGTTSFASASFVQGYLAACHMQGDTAFNAEQNQLVPYGIYSIPEIAGVGLTEEEAIERGFDVAAGRAKYKNVTQADVSRTELGVLKLVFEKKSHKLLGVHILGEYATDLIHTGQSVMGNGGTIDYFTQSVMNYPTFSEAYRLAAFHGLNRLEKNLKLLDTSED